MKTYRFIKTGGQWFIDLPEYIEQGGHYADLQMVEGADTMLDMMADGEASVTLQIAEEPFEGPDMLLLTEKCDPGIGGGYYLMPQYEGRQIDQMMWLCQVTEFVFGYLPERIFVKNIQ
ncbi:DUF6717 family protein [Chitinophagaceae bacterium MMS25-I14]